MSVYFMRDNHTFVRLDTLPIDQAIARVRELTDEQGGYADVFTKHDGDMCSECGRRKPNDRPEPSVQWSPFKPNPNWEADVRQLLQEQQP